MGVKGEGQGSNLNPAVLNAPVYAGIPQRIVHRLITGKQ